MEAESNFGWTRFYFAHPLYMQRLLNGIGSSTKEIEVELGELASGIPSAEEQCSKFKMEISR